MTDSEFEEYQKFLKFQEFQKLQNGTSTHSTDFPTDFNYTSKNPTPMVDSTQIDQSFYTESDRLLDELSAHITRESDYSQLNAQLNNTDTIAPVVEFSNDSHNTGNFQPYNANTYDTNNTSSMSNQFNNGVFDTPNTNLSHTDIIPPVYPDYSAPQTQTQVPSSTTPFTTQVAPQVSVQPVSQPLVQSTPQNFATPSSSISQTQTSLVTQPTVQPTVQQASQQQSVAQTPNDSLISRQDLRKGYKMRVLKTLVKDIVIVFFVALILSTLLKTFIFSPFQVPSGSMEETLMPGDKIISNKTALWSELNRGDIVVFKDTQNWLNESTVNQSRQNSNAVLDFFKFVGFVPEDDSSYLVKRIIGLPGDRIKSEGGDAPITINDTVLDKEPYIKYNTHFSRIPFDITVPEGKLWVMGDNRDNSADSRYHMNDKSKGFIEKQDVEGVVNWIISPFDRFGSIDSDVEKLKNIKTNN